MNNVLVTGHSALIDTLSLPDPDDRHVLAAALHANAQVIVTFNLKDFPQSVLGPFGIRAISPDVLVTELLEHSPHGVCAVVDAQARALKNPPMSLSELLDKLEQQRLPRSVAGLRQLFKAIGAF